MLTATLTCVSTAPIYSQPTPNSSGAKVSDVTEQEDPYLWLENVAGDKPLAWVTERNEITNRKYQSEEFRQLEEEFLKILDSDERIPLVEKHGEYYYNFWRDQQHERGVWRRTTLEQYRLASPQWEVILDLDAIAGQESENWVWNQAQLLKPDCDRALISLSRGGADATVTREFDMKSLSFMADGFQRAESKGGMRWIDRDNVFIFTDFGAGSMTSSGYPRIVKKWKRGQPLDQAVIVYEGVPDDMYISAMHDDSLGFERNFVQRTIAFYKDELYVYSDEGELHKIDAPDSANKTVHREHLLLELREPWDVGGIRFAAGSLLAANLADFMTGKRELTLLFEPNQRTSLDGFSATKDYLLLNILEDVKNRVVVLKSEGANRWNEQPLLGSPSVWSLTISAVDPDHSNAYWLSGSDFITPDSLFLGDVGGQPELIKQLTAQFDASRLEVAQHFATSQDGTRVPYFVVADRELKLDGNNPTLLYGYGGFEIPLKPTYSPLVGHSWYGLGGVYVVANIRGGGEYGPRWHQAALKQNRLRAYEDFAAVATDLVEKKFTSVARLGIKGGSNGGLLVGNMVALYPDLFSAAVCQVPLLDMRRYHRLLAGASWMAEYGNPDAEGEWDFIKTYSPYQNIQSGKRYPPILFTTSTRDDRVHPGHARKMMALMEAQGHTVEYYENIEGGHGGAANNRQRAYVQALSHAFLKARLVPAR